MRPQLFYLVWFVLALAQASATQLIDDEAYYWVHSKYLAWGYLDHPPMIALLVKAGYSLFQHELGVRLVPVLMNLFTIIITEKLIAQRNRAVYYAIVISLGALHLAGILAVPDTPLLFFTAIFFFAYKKFIEHTTWKYAALLGISAALLLFSKYHGLLVVMFTIISNPRLLLRGTTWLAAAITVLFLLPHVVWQSQHDWISLRYHLFESNINTYRLSNTTDYLLGQILLTGPVAGIILLPAAFLYKPANSLDRALKFTLFGIFLFFFLSTFRGKVEANWTMPMIIPLVVLGHHYIISHLSWMRMLWISLIPALVLILAARIYLVMDIGPDNAVKNRFHNNKEWVRDIAKKTGELPVVFNNSYQRASRFWFYAQKPSYSFNDYRERYNLFSFSPGNYSLLGNSVYHADIYELQNFPDSVVTKKGAVGIRYDSMFTPLGNLWISSESKTFNLSTTGNQLRLKFRTRCSDLVREFILQHPHIKTELWLGVFRNKQCVRQIQTRYTAMELIQTKTFEFVADMSGLPSGNYHLRFGMKAKDYFPTHCSDKIPVRVEEPGF